MIITKQYILKLFEETHREFQEKVMKTPNIEIKFVEKEPFIENAKKAFTNKLMIEKGIIKNFDKEYPSFMVVYPMDKNPLALLMLGAYKISICYEIAREKLKPFTAKEIKDYLKHGFAHEMSHIFENDIKNKRPDLWEKALGIAKGIENLAHENLAEYVADLICDSKDYKKIEELLWGKIMANARKMGFGLK